MSALFCYRRRMRRFTLALVALLVFAEAAYAFRTPSVRSRNRSDAPTPEAPATVRMPDDAKPADPARPDITVEGQPAPAITVVPPKPEPPKVAAVPEKPAVVAVPAPTPPKPEVVAVPIPAAPAPVVVAPPAPPPAPVVAAPPPPPPPAAVVAAPSPPPPAPKPAVVAAPPPAPAAEERKPQPIVALPKPAPPPSSVVAMAAPSPAAAKPAVAAGRPDPRLIENIFACFSPGLPNEWKKAWVVLNETGPDRTKLDAKFFYAVRDNDDKGEAFTPCNVRAVADSVYSLNDLLTPEQRRWGTARLLITNEGAYELKYDYPK